MKCLIFLLVPAVKRVVYSTCSIYVEENELVVQVHTFGSSICFIELLHHYINPHNHLKEVLETTNGFKLVKALPDWKHRGLEVFEGGKLTYLFLF